jgi:hypothetical protein
MLKDRFGNLDEILLKNKLPSIKEIDFILYNIEKEDVKGRKETEFINRIIIGLEILKNLINPLIESCDVSKIKLFLGEKNYKTITSKLVRNSFSNDLHFLPKDNDDIEWSSVPLHSIVLFRYPITVPIEVFDLANDPNCADWDGALTNLKQIYQIASQFEKMKPLKTTTIDNDFLSDILTRFVGLYVRIGSPDFSNETVIEIIDEI